MPPATPPPPPFLTQVLSVVRVPSPRVNPRGVGQPGGVGVGVDPSPTPEVGGSASNPNREDASFMVRARATANTAEGNRRASRELGSLCSHSHGVNPAERRRNVLEDDSDSEDETHWFSHPLAAGELSPSGIDAGAAGSDTAGGGAVGNTVGGSAAGDTVGGGGGWPRSNAVGAAPKALANRSDGTETAGAAPRVLPTGGALRTGDETETGEARRRALGLSLQENSLQENSLPRHVASSLSGTIPDAEAADLFRAQEGESLLVLNLLSTWGDAHYIGLTALQVP